MSDRNADPGRGMEPPTGKLKVLFLAADPFRSQARLELGEEVRAVGEAVRRSGAHGAVELVAHFAARPRDVQHALLRHEPHIVHVVGRGVEDGFIYLSDEHGRPRALDREALTRLFAVLTRQARVVMLNDGHTLALAEVLARAVDFVIGHDGRLADEAYISFASTFYSALAHGTGVPQAFRLAVAQLRMDGSGAGDGPVLRVRDGAADAPLLALPIARYQPGAGEIHRQTHRSEGDGPDFGIVDGEGRLGSGGWPVSQGFAESVRSRSQIKIVGRRSGGDRQAPDPSGQRSPPADPAAHEVLLGGSAPGRARPGDTILVQFAAYVAAFAWRVRQRLERDAEPEEVRLGEPATGQWAAGARVSVRCRANGLVVPTPVQHFTWDGRWRTVSFDVEVPEDARFKSTVVVLEAFIHDGDDAVQVAALRMPLHLVRTSARRPRARWVHSRAARKAFASYASQDRADVLARVSSIARSTGMDIFVDRTSLRMGEEWEPALLAHIAESERFLLFWSEFAAQSAWVRREMDEAIAAHGEDVLELHLLRHVPADSIPERLRKFHFDDPYLLARDADLHRERAASPPDG